MITIKEWQGACEKFRNIFHKELKDYMEVYVVKKETILSFDLFTFEKFLKEKGYKEWSMADFIKDQYGEEAKDFISTML